MIRALELESLKLKAMEQNAYSLGGNNYNRVSTSNSKDFTDRMNAFIDKQYYDYFKSAGLKEYYDEISTAKNKLNELKQEVTGNALLGLYVCDLMYIQGMKGTAVENALDRNRRVLYEGRRAFFEYCDERKIFED